MSDMNNWADKMEQDLAHANERARDAEHKAQQLQAELDALKAAHAWIKTSERVPEETCDVLGIVDGVVTLLNYYDEFEDDPFDAVSHWMPLPEPPK